KTYEKISRNKLSRRTRTSSNVVKIQRKEINVKFIYQYTEVTKNMTETSKMMFIVLAGISLILAGVMGYSLFYTPEI
ncbi:MAG: hypothetical protein QW666_02200, partial [Candidatus Woesearchaeota archaeon]